MHVIIHYDDVKGYFTHDSIWAVDVFDTRI